MKPSLVIIGLGNPGKAYENTRHNTGFRALEALSSAYGQGPWEEKQKFHSLTQEARVVTVPVLLVKPQTFMNRSGEAVKKIVDFYKLNAAEQLLILCDDIDLPLGETRLRKSGGPGTHNGLKSLVTYFGEDFPRLRIGLGSRPPETDLAAWVLSVPGTTERQALAAAFASLPALLEQYILDLPARKSPPATQEG